MTRFGLDIDGTYTRDPHLWSLWIQLAEQQGNEVYFVTGRSQSDGVGDLPNLPPIPVVYCGPYELKIEACLRQGIQIDVWIENEPGTVEPQRIANEALDSEL